MQFTDTSGKYKWNVMSNADSEGMSNGCKVTFDLGVKNIKTI